MCVCVCVTTFMSEDGDSVTETKKETDAKTVIEMVCLQTAVW